tara:strand:+ start:623 stop:934 length:312 start_codon:yes stop_codon:yes gene_type:complete
VNPYTWGLDIVGRRVAPHKIPRAVIDLVEERDGGRHCVSCRRLGISTPPDVPLELDHIQEVSKGGSNHFSNLRWLCKSHNAGRRGRPSELKTPAWYYKRVKGS